MKGAVLPLRTINNGRCTMNNQHPTKMNAGSPSETLPLLPRPLYNCRARSTNPPYLKKQTQFPKKSNAPKLIHNNNLRPIGHLVTRDKANPNKANFGQKPSPPQPKTSLTSCLPINCAYPLQTQKQTRTKPISPRTRPIRSALPQTENHCRKPNPVIPCNYPLRGLGPTKTNSTVTGDRRLCPTKQKTSNKPSSPGPQVTKRSAAASAAGDALSATAISATAA